MSDELNLLRDGIPTGIALILLAVAVGQVRPGVRLGPQHVLVGQDLAVHDPRGERPDLVDPVRYRRDGLDVHLQHATTVETRELRRQCRRT